MNYNTTKRLLKNAIIVNLFFIPVQYMRDYKKTGGFRRMIYIKNIWPCYQNLNWQCIFCAYFTVTTCVLRYQHAMFSTFERINMVMNFHRLFSTLWWNYYFTHLFPPSSRKYLVILKNKPCNTALIKLLCFTRLLYANFV